MMKAVETPAIKKGKIRRRHEAIQDETPAATKADETDDKERKAIAAEVRRQQRVSQHAIREQIMNQWRAMREEKEKSGESWKTRWSQGHKWSRKPTVSKQKPEEDKSEGEVVKLTWDEGLWVVDELVMQSKKANLFEWHWPTEVLHKVLEMSAQYRHTAFPGEAHCLCDGLCLLQLELTRVGAKIEGPRVSL